MLIQRYVVPTGILLQKHCKYLLWKPIFLGSMRHFRTLEESKKKGVNVYTKYRVTHLASENEMTYYDDLYLSKPSKNDFAVFNKDITLFLRYLKLITGQEQRLTHYKQFEERCATGLLVEKDVFITRQELLDNMWENGYSNTQIKALEMAFSENYKFHYPELAVLFNISEENCYEYCLRARVMSSTSNDLVELKLKKHPNMVVPYAIMSVLVWLGIQSNAVTNMWTMVKTWPFFAVIYMIASRFQNNILKKFYSNDVAEEQAAIENRVDGEEKIYSQIRKFGNDRQCLASLKAFRPTVETQMRQYKLGVLMQFRQSIVDGMIQHLDRIAQQEQRMQYALQKVIINEVIHHFLQEDCNTIEFENNAFNAAIKALSNPKTEIIDDPVGECIKTSLKQIENAKLYKQRNNNVLLSPTAESVSLVYDKLEQEFLDDFTVRENEIKILQPLAQKTGNDINLNKLSRQDLETINILYRNIMQRVGLQCVLPQAYQDYITTLEAEPFDNQNNNNNNSNDASKPSISSEAEILMNQLKEQFHQVYLRKFLRLFNDM